MEEVEAVLVLEPSQQGHLTRDRTSRKWWLQAGNPGV